MTTVTALPALRSVTRREQAEARERLGELLGRGQRVYVILRHVSRSGMLRRVSVVVHPKATGYAGAAADVLDVTGLVGRALDYRRDGDGYLPIGGCGFSVATHVVGALSWALYGSEYLLVAETL